MCDSSYRCEVRVEQFVALLCGEKRWVREHWVYCQRNGRTTSKQFLRRSETLLRSVLQSWDWAYGQTPEFTYTLKNSFEWGNAVSSSSSSVEILTDILQFAKITSKHGIILSCDISVENMQGYELGHDTICKALLGKKYGFVDNVEHERTTAGKHGQDLWAWLRPLMNTWNLDEELMKSVYYYIFIPYKVLLLTYNFRCIKNYFSQV